MTHSQPVWSSVSKQMLAEEHKYYVNARHKHCMLMKDINIMQLMNYYKDKTHKTLHKAETVLFLKCGELNF
jgi:hypothetical protein